MARTGQKLINYHSSGSSEIVLTNLDYGEIAVRHKPDQPELIIKTGTDTKAVFIDSQAIDSKISASQVNIEGQLEAIDERLDTIESGYAKSGVVNTLVSTEKANAVSSSKGYTDAVVSEASAATLSVVSANYATITQHNALNNTVTGHTAAINSANTRLNAIEPKANSALQGFKLTGTSATTGTGNQTTQYGAVANFTTGGNATLDLSNLIIDCGDF